MDRKEDQIPADNDDQYSFFEQSAHTTLNKSEASLILSHYSTQQYSSHRQVTGGIANSNYCITSKDELCFFCKICDEMTEEDTWTQLKALISLQPYGLQIAYPLKRITDSTDRALDTNTNENVKVSDEILIGSHVLRISSIRSLIVMYEWKHGRMGNFSSLSCISYRSLGTALARIHSVDYGEYLYLPSFSMGMAYMLPLYYEELPTLSKSLRQHPFVSVLEKELQRVCQTLYKKTSYEVYKDRDYMATNDNCKQDSKNQTDSLPLAILHGDLFLENMLFQPDGKLDAIIDWECICIGERLMDVTMALVGCCYDSTDTLSIPRATAFLSTYGNIVSLTSREREYFGTFLCYSLLSIACYRWHRFNVRFPADRRSDSYLPMLKRLNDVNSKVVQQLLAT